MDSKNKNHLLLQVVILFCLCPLAFSQSTSHFFEFIQSQSQRHYSDVPHEVLAVYYGWYGKQIQTSNGVMDSAWYMVNTNKHETGRTARFPVKGGYSSHDASVIDWQIDQAKSHGITGFVVSWFGTGPEAAWIEQSMQLLIERAEKKDFKIAIYLEQAPGEGRDQIGRAIGEISYALQRYGKSKAFLKVDGRPVLFAYGRIIYQVPVAAWADIIEGIRAKGNDLVLLADGHQPSYAYLFDGIHSYDLAGLPIDLERHLQRDKLDELRAWAAQYYRNGVRLAREHDRISCLQVEPGCDQRKAYNFNWQTDRLDGEMYRTLWDEAIKAAPDWVLITSWNEWPEGTEIEPSLELGSKYLDITAEYAQRFLKSPTVTASAPLLPPRFAPGTTQPMDKLLAGQRVAVLMEDQKNDAEFWAAYCGATVQRVTWKDVVEPGFNATNFSIFLHISGDHYQSTVKTPDDVVRALVRYLGQGGFLLSLSKGNWPLLYNDSNGGIPQGITDILGMGIDNGFEVPPPGVQLSFVAKTNLLPGLPARAAFPQDGDLRWRPMTPTRALKNDYYLGLVQLQDNQGGYYDNAAAYIFHRSPPLAPGKSLHVWPRTAEAFGPDIFYPSLFNFISTKLNPIGTTH